MDLGSIPCIGCRVLRWLAARLRSPRSAVAWMLAGSLSITLMLTTVLSARGGPAPDKAPSWRTQLQQAASAAVAPLKATAASAVASAVAATVGAASAAATAAAASAASALDAAATAIVRPPGPVDRPPAVLVSASAASAAASAAASTPAAASAGLATRPLPATAVDIRLTHPTVILPAGKVGTPYGPLPVVRGGTAPYDFSLRGAAPPGLDLPDAQGILSGTPTAAGNFSFTLAVRDASVPPLTTEQRYVMRVNGPRPAAPKAASAPAPKTATVPLDLADREVDRDRGQPRSYRITDELLQALAEPAAPEAAASAPDDVPPAPPLPVPATVAAAALLPTAKQLEAMLKPLVGIEFPTRDLFVAALKNQQCLYYLQYMKLVASAPQSACPKPVPTAGPAPRSAPLPAGSLSGDEFFRALLPPELLTQIVQEAMTIHPVFTAPALRLDGEGCGCATALGTDEIYSVLPFWQRPAAAPPPPAGSAATTAQESIRVPVNFEYFHRLSFLGAVLDDDGHYELPPRWDPTSSALAREARRHGTALDLAVYRRHWTPWLQLPEADLRARARRAGAEAVRLADVELTDASWSDWLQQFFWHEHRHQYDGLTLMFDDLPAPKSGPAAAFSVFLESYLDGVVRAMQESGRAYRLNLVVPQDLLGDDGPYTFRLLMDLLHKAETRRRAKAVEPDNPYKGTTDILVSFLVVVPEPTRDTKHDLRAKFDNTKQVEGPQRNALLESVVAVYLFPGGPPRPLAEAERTAFDANLAYAQWNFGGSGLWPLPLAADGGAAGALDSLKLAYKFPQRTSDALCRIVCPNRAPLRLLLELLIVLVAAGTATYLLDCRVRRLGRSVLLALWAGGVAALLMAGALLTCDPTLAPLRDSNFLLYALIALLCAGGLYYTFKPKVDLP